MKNGQATNLTIEVNGQVYTMTRPGYYYSKVGGKQKRISKDEWNATYEIWERENKKEVKDKKTEENFKKKSRRSKDVALEYRGITLTTKQVAFIKAMPEDSFYENGLDSSLWIDVFCDTVADRFSPMAVGAMVSTLKEKGLLTISSERVNGKKSKYMTFTDAGKQIAKELGLA